MKYFLRSVLICFTLLFGFSSSVVMLSRAQATSEVLPELRQCDTGMCLFNIAPDITNADTAENTIKNTGLFKSWTTPRLYKQSYPFYGLDLFRLENRVSAAPHSVSELELYFPQMPDGYNQITAASIVSRYGPPCTVGFSYNMIFHYPSMVLFFQTKSSPTVLRVEPTGPLRQINIFKHAVSCPAVLAYPNAFAWHALTIYPGSLFTIQ